METLSAEIDREIGKLPRVQGFSQQHMSRSLNDVLERAFTEADKFKDDYVSAEHLFLAIANKDATYAALLIEEKLTGKTVKIDAYHNPEREKEKWNPYYLDIAILQNDIPAILAHAESLFKITYDIRYYDLLKEYFPKDKWHKKFEELELSLFRKHYSFGILATIYIQEGKNRDLFELLKKHAFLNNIRDTLPILLPGYAAEVLTLYNKALISLLNHATVSAYKDAVDHLQYLLSLDRRETVQNWIETFKSIYSNRPRLLKELAKIKI